MRDFKETMQRVAELHDSVAIRTRGGKTYTQVVHRMQAFRECHGLNYGVDTQLILDDGHRVVMKAVIIDKEGNIIGSGFAEEIRELSDKRQVNYTSAIENCETSAVGRALASIGLSGGEYASANELDGVSRKTEAKQTQKFCSAEQVKELADLIQKSGADQAKMYEHYKIADLTQLPEDRFVNAKQALETKLKQKEKQNGQHDQASELSGEGRPSSKDKSAEVLAELRANMGLETEAGEQQ